MIFRAVFFLFFLQVLTRFVEATHAFGLLSTSIPPESGAALLLLSPALLLIPPIWRLPHLTQALFVILAAARLVTPFTDTLGTMLACGIGTAAALALLPLLLTSQEGERSDGSGSPTWGVALLLAVSAAIFLRALGSGTDASMSGVPQLFAWGLATAAFARMPGSGIRGPASGGRTGGLEATHLAIGLIGALTLLYFAFSAPSVLVRWTGVDYTLVLTCLCLSLVAYCVLARLQSPWSLLTMGRLAALNLAFVAALVLTVLAHHVQFPANPSGYPLVEPQPPVWAGLALGLTLLLFPVLFLDFELLSRGLVQVHPSQSALGLAFFIASLFLAIAILAQILTASYDYVPVVGDVFRGRFWAVILVVSGVLATSMLSLPKGALGAARVPLPAVGIAALTGMASVVGALLVQAYPTHPGEPDSLVLVTYNIQQGYGEDGRKDLNRQLDLIRDLDPDVLGLQESDSTRVAGGNDDVVRYFADHLNMYSYSGPKTVVGTFGIALLSKFPLENTQTFYLYSEGEQTAVITAEVEVGDRRLTVLVTHLGNGGPSVQQEEILSLTSGVANQVLMGDFNFRRDGSQYRLTLHSLTDADEWQDPLSQRIDHVFVSPGIEVLEGRYVESPASDHPALQVIIGW